MPNCRGRIIRSVTLACLAGSALLAVGAIPAQAAAVDHDCGDEPTDCGVAYAGGMPNNMVTVSPGGASVVFTESGGDILVEVDGPEGCQLSISATVGTCPLPTGMGHVSVAGNEGNDTLSARPGNTGLRVVFGGGGDDTLNLADGNVQALIDCGPGNDVAYLDANDPPPSGCESVNPIASVAPTPPQDPPLPTPDGDADGVPDASDGCPSTVGPFNNSGCPFNAFSFAGKAQSKKGFTLIKVTVPGPGIVKAAQAVVTKKKPALIKAAKISASKAGTVVLRINTNKAGKKLLATADKFTVKAKFTFTPKGGKSRGTFARVKFIR